MPDGYGLQLGTLADTGGRIADLADDARNVTAAFVDGVRRNDGQNAGFATTSMISTLCGSWESRLAGLCQQTGESGGLLDTSDRTYGEHEVANAGSLDQIEPGGGRGLVP